MVIYTYNRNGGRKMRDKLDKLEELFNKIKDEVYIEADYPHTGTIFNPKISPELLQGLEETLTEMNEVLQSGLIQDILDKIEYGSPIEELSSFDVDKEKQRLFASDEETWDVEERDTNAQEEAAEEEERLFENAKDDIKTLIDDLLPTLLGF
jgi:hypothetical protein